MNMQGEKQLMGTRTKIGRLRVVMVVVVVDEARYGDYLKSPMQVEEK